jgi:hypothetical protein
MLLLIFIIILRHSSLTLQPSTTSLPNQFSTYSRAPLTSHQLVANTNADLINTATRKWTTGCFLRSVWTVASATAVLSTMNRKANFLLSDEKLTQLKPLICRGTGPFYPNVLFYNSMQICNATTSVCPSHLHNLRKNRRILIKLGMNIVTRDAELFLLFVISCHQ